MVRAQAASTRTLTTTEAAVLALLAIQGERSAYDLHKLVERNIAHVWRPARTQLYAVLPRLETDGLASSHTLTGRARPDKRLYSLTEAGREALDAWLTTIEPGAESAFFLKLFVGGLATIESSIAQVESFREEVETRLAVLQAIEPTNTRTGHDRFHYLLLRLGIERQEHLLRWCDWVLEELSR
jgi:PadR family transcriptional regulator, regulatory protein AphA